MIQTARAMATPIQIASPRRPPVRPRGLLPGLVAVSLALLVTDIVAPRLTAPLRNSLLALSATPVQGVDHLQRGLGALGTFATDTLYSTQRITALELEIKQLRDYALATQILQHENQELRQAMNVLPAAPLEFVSARLLRGTGNVWHLRFQGGRVEPGMAAVQDNQLLGRVWQVSGEAALLLPLSDPRSRVPVVSQRSGQAMILSGTGNPERLAVRYGAETTTTLSVGEALVTSASGSLFPAGLPVATVMRASDGSLYAAPLANLKHVGWAQLIRYRAPLMVATGLTPE
jgi:rod shape-determining protein MreC